MAVTVLPRNKLTKTAVNRARGLTAARRGLPADHPRFDLGSPAVVWAK
jgi:hypothetical protein